MAEHSRIEELRRRVQQDPSSIAFAQLAEALRRDGAIEEAIDTCRSGLSHHPGYLSAHVTLGRALIEAGDLEAARDELAHVLAEAPENLAAVRGLAEIHQRRGEVGEALAHYRRALELAPQDTEIESLVSQLSAEAPPAAPPAPAFAGASGPIADFPSERAIAAEPVEASLADWLPAAAEPVEASLADALTAAAEPGLPDQTPAAGPGEAAAPGVPGDGGSDGPPESAQVASRQAEALERWLDAILADREQQG